LFSISKIKKISINNVNKKKIEILQKEKNVLKGIVNFWLINFYILTGKLTFVGAPITLKGDNNNNLIYKPGLTGLIQLNSDKQLDENEIKKYEIFYLKNQNLWLDIEIIFRSMFFK
jgi:hypothetical protein